MRRILLVAAALFMTQTPAFAGGDGGSSPDVLKGGDGISRGAYRYVATPTGRDTVLQEIHRRSGRVMRWTVVTGNFGIPVAAFDGTAAGLSHDARTLVLDDVASSQALMKQSELAIFDLRRFKLRAFIKLRGDFAFDAISPHGRMLYLTERLSGSEVTKYRVRAYDVGARRLLPQPLADKRYWDSDMYGYAMSRVDSRDGRWAYTLYAGGPFVFVHALDTTGPAAYCIFLPDTWGETDAPSMRLRLASGNRLLVRPVQRGKPFAEIDLVNLRVLRAVRHP
jgi:hypothetical protein